MIMHPQCLLDIPDDYEITSIVQEIECGYDGEKRSYLLYRDEVGDVTDIKALFSNDAYLENGEVKFDEKLSVLEEAFNDEVTDDLNFLQNIYVMDVGDVLEKEVTLYPEPYISYERTITYTLVINEVC